MYFERLMPLPVLSNILLILIIFWLLKPAIHKDEEIEPKRLYWGIGLVFLFCVFAFWNTDWIHYQYIFNDLKQAPDSNSHLEQIYIEIIKICPTYLIFRVVVWGTALLLLYLTIRLLELNMSLTWFIFGVLFLLFFSYARISLAMAMMIYGVALFFKPNQNYKLSFKILGIVFILSSIFFHKSALIGVIIILFSSVISVTNKNSWFYLIFCYCVACILIQILLVKFTSGGIVLGEESLNESLINTNEYINRESSIGIGAIGTNIRVFFERITYFLMALLCYKLQNNYLLPKHIEIISKINLYLVIFACLFIIDYGFRTNIFYGRVLRFTLIPSSIILSYTIQHHLYSGFVKYIYGFALMGTISALLYSFYVSIVT